jgi:hypothetical protein
MEAEPRPPSDIEKAHWIDQAMENKPQNFLEVSNTNTEEGDVLAIVSNVEEGPQPQATGVLEDETRWVTGIPLFTFIATTTVVIFLILLDTSIISTVWRLFSKSVRQSNFIRQFQGSLPTSIHCLTSAGMVARIYWRGMSISYVRYNCHIVKHLTK